MTQENTRHYATETETVVSTRANKVRVLNTRNHQGRATILKYIKLNSIQLLRNAGQRQIKTVIQKFRKYNASS